MSEISVQAKRRALSTKGAVNQLRKSGNVPCVFYSKSSEPIPLTLAESTLKPLVFTSETHIINLKIDDNDACTSILKNVQFDPVTDRIIHCDFLGISADQEIEIEVPVLLEGQAKGVKEGGVIQHSMHKLRVSCLPADIPDHITINISDIALGQSIHVRDLKIDRLKFVQHDDVIIVSITLPRAVQEPAAATAALPGEEVKEPEIISKGKQTEEEE
jgi:large subunit ribosomal protein L25